MTEALEKHHGTVSIGGRTITNLRFADDIDGLAGDEEELEALAECLDTASKKYGMEINTDKTNVITSNPTASKMTSILMTTHLTPYPPSNT